jgi:hypothetical protein
LGQGSGVRSSVVSEASEETRAVDQDSERLQEAPCALASVTADRRWDTELQRWVYGIEVSDALNDAQAAIFEYYNGDRDWAERWLLRAYEANQGVKK